MPSATGLKVTVWGEGDPALLVHGSFGWGTETWGKQHPLADSYKLVLVDRRGFGGTPASGQVDFERDADDVAALLEEGEHLVGHSYGGVVSLLAAARRRDAVRSLTVIEPPALGVARGIPVVEEFIAGIDDAISRASGPSDYRVRFLRAFGVQVRPEELSGVRLGAARSSWGERRPWEAEIPFDDLRGIPTLVVRGDWSDAPSRARELGGGALHAVCHVLERELGADSATFPATHNPQLLGDPFNERLRRFWESA